MFEESNSAALKRQRARNLINWSAGTEGEGRTTKSTEEEKGEQCLAYLASSLYRVEDRGNGKRRRYEGSCIVPNWTPKLILVRTSLGD